MTTAVVLYSAAEAKRLTARIRGELDKMDVIAERVAPMLAEAKEHEAWRGEGCDSWEEYCVERLGISRRRSYQLLDLVGVEREVSALLGAPVTFPERVARDLKPRMAQFKTEVAAQVEAGLPPQEAADTAAQTVRARKPDPKPVGKRHGRQAPRDLTGFLKSIRENIERVQASFDDAGGDALAYMTYEALRDLERTAQTAYEWAESTIAELQKPREARPVEDWGA